MSKPTKRRRPGEGAVYKRPNGTYAAILDLGLDPNGKRRRRHVYGKTEDEVLKKLGVLRRQLEDHGDIPTADMRVGKWLTYWLDNIARPRVKPGTFTSYRTHVNRYLIPSIGRRPLSRLSAAHVREMHAYVRSQGCNSTTARNAHRTLAAALNDAVKDGRVARNVAALVNAPPKAASKRGALSFTEAKAVLSHAGERMASRWLAAFLLAARQGECLGLRWEYVDLDRGMVDLAWSLQKVAYEHGCTPRCSARTAKGCPQKYLPVPDGFEFTQLDGNLCLLRPKSRTSQRVLPLPDMLWEALKLRRIQSLAEPNPHGLVWTRPDGRPINPKDDWTAWKALLLSAGVRSFTLHEARHSTVTWLAEGGAAENVIVGIAGHSDVMVSRSYQHVSPEVGRRALNSIAAGLATESV